MIDENGLFGRANRFRFGLIHLQSGKKKSLWVRKN